MKRKYLLRGIGIGLIIGMLVSYTAFKTGDYTDKPFIQTVNADAHTNVDRMINRICSPNKVEDVEKGWSYFLQTRANDPQYKLDNKYIEVKPSEVIIGIYSIREVFLKA